MNTKDIILVDFTKDLNENPSQMLNGIADEITRVIQEVSGHKTSHVKWVGNETFGRFEVKVPTIVWAQKGVPFLSDAMEQQGWSYLDLSEKSGVSVEIIEAAEMDEALVSTDDLKKIVAAFPKGRSYPGYP